MRRAREHTRQIARQLSQQQQDDENDDMGGGTPWLGQDELAQVEKLGQTDFFPTQQQPEQQKQPQHHSSSSSSSNEASFAEWGEWSPQPPQSEASFSTTTTAKKKKKTKNPMSLDAFVEQQQQQPWPPRAASVVSESRGRERYEQRTAPPTFPSNSTMLARNHPTTLVSPSNAAARRRMRRRQQQEHERPPEQENYPTLADTTTTTTPSSGLKGLSGESSRSLGSSSAGRPPRRPQVSRVPNTPGAASTSNSTVSNSSADMPAAGFSFDAFGLDARQVDQEVNEALQDLGVDHPDLFWQQQQNDEEFPPQSFDTPPGSSRASSPGTPLHHHHDDDDGFENGFRIMGGGGLPLHVRQSPASSERSSLTNSTDRNNNNNNHQNNNSRVNPFKEQAGFFRSRPSPNRRQQSPVTAPNQTTNDWAVFDQLPNKKSSTNWTSPQQQQEPELLPKLPHLDDDDDEDDAAGFGDNWASDSSSDLVGRSSSNGGAWSDVGVKSDVGRNSDIGVVPTEVVSPRKSTKKPQEEDTTPPVSALKKSWETKTATTPTRPRITTTTNGGSPQYLYRQESPVRELKQAWEQKVSRTPPTAPPQRPRARSPLMQESIERLGEQLGDEIMTPETITRKWPLQHAPPQQQQPQQQARAAECMEQRTSFASYRERLKPASSNNNNNVSLRSPTANHLEPTNKAPFVKLRKTGAMERFESTGTQEEEEEEETQDAWKQADPEQEPVPTEPRKLTYRERREQELEQQRQKEQEAQRAKSTQSKPAERDVASLIRRRIAANKRSAAAAHQAATAAVAGDTEKTTDLSSLRSRLRKVSMESKITQIRSSVARPKPTVVEPKANPTPASKQQQEQEEPTPNKTVAELMAERMASMSSSSPSVKKEPSVPDKKSISASSDTTKTKLDAFFSHRLTDGPNLASLSKDEDDDNDKKNDNDDDHFAIAKSRKNKEKSRPDPAPKPATATTAAAPSAPVQPAPPVDSRAFDGRPALKDDPKYDRYFRMLKVGMPMEVVKHAMTRDGMDPSVMDGDHGKPAGFAAGVPLKNDPLYEKYFKMLKIGLPMGAVKNAMERDGMDPSVMDGDHNLPANSKGGKDGDKGTESKPKDKYRRTRLHWETVRKVRSDSLWAQIDEDKDVQDIDIDEQEFKELFQAEVLPTQSKAKNATGPTKRGAAVRVIDSKRANNGGIILARLKMTHDEMAEAVDKIDGEHMSSEQMQNIIEYLPTAEERKLLEEYMLSGGTDAAEKFDGLCECEKFMVAMMTVKHAKRKVRALLFKLQFSSCIESLEQDAAMVESACDDLINSVRLRKLLGIVLNIGNRLNTAGSTSKSKAGAFTLESLLKLSQAKAFDRKTTFLHYIVLVVQRNNELLLRFKDDLPTVMKADKVYWDQVVSDLEEVENQLENVRRVALHQAQLAFRYSLRKMAKKPRENDNGDDDDSMSDTSMTLEEEVEALRATAIGLFTLGAIKQVSALRDKVENTKTKFSRLLEYFGEDERQEIQPHELFTIICTFCRDFDRAKEQVYDNVKKKKREERKKQANPPKAQNVAKQQQPPPRREPAPAPLRASSMQPNVSAVMKLDKQAAGKNGVHRPQDSAATPLTKNAAAAPSSSSSHPRRNGENSRLQRATRHRQQQQQHSYSNQQRRVQQPEAAPAVSKERPPTEASTPSPSSQGMTMRQKARLRRNRMASSRYGNASVSPSTTSSPVESPTVVKATTPKKTQVLEQSNVPLSPRSSIRNRRRMEQRQQL